MKKQKAFEATQFLFKLLHINKKWPVRTDSLNNGSKEEMYKNPEQSREVINRALWVQTKNLGRGIDRKSIPE
ncbi:hypothetical protein ACJJIE_21380 [Microbulbifer sp. TRSA001]|uniref:hypothetical protein n=1 Tax=Microbulbifer sp. TRSA001 TaxID=3243381 RepID=UPI00403A0281